MTLSGFLAANLHLFADGPRDFYPVLQVPVRSWGQHQGFAQPIVHALARDAKGYVWVGTDEGLYRLNGQAIARFDPPEQGLPQSLMALSAGPDGSLWVGRSAGGISRFLNGTWTHFPMLGDYRDPTVHAFAQTAHGLLAATSAGLFHWKGDAWVRWEGIGGDILCLAVQGTGEDQILWAGTTQGLGRRHRGTWQWFGARDGLPSGRVQSLAASRARDGEPGLWIGTDKGLAHWERGRVRPAPRDIRLPYAQVSSLLAVDSPSGQTVWVGTPEGLGLWDGAQFQVLDRRSALPSPTIHCLLDASDPTGPTQVWAGTGQGVSMFQGGPWRTVRPVLSKPEGIPFPVLQGGRDQTLWVGTNQGLLRFQKGAWTTLPGLEGRRIYALFQEGPPETPVLWIGGKEGDFSCFEQGRLRALPPLPELVRTILRPREADPSGALWVGTSKGPYLLRGYHWEPLSKSGVFPEIPVMRMFELPDTDGKPVVVIATQRQDLAVYRAGAVSWLKCPTGMEHWNLYDLKPIRDAEGRVWLWAGTRGHGLFRARWEGTRNQRPGEGTTAAPIPLDWEPVPLGDPNTASRVIYTLQQDRHGRIYVFTSGGILRLSPRPNAAGFEQEVWTLADGLPDNDCNTNGSFIDGEGRIWASTALGLAMFDPAKDQPDTRPKPLQVESFQADGRDLPRDGAAFDPHQRNYRVTFALLSYHRPEETRYRTQLEGLEAAPTPWTAQAFREFPTLPPRNYRLKIWGKDHAGNRSGPVILSFRILPPFWMTPWALGLYLVAGAAAILGLLRWRSAALVREKVALEALVQERTRSLAETHAQALASEKAQARAESEARAKSEFLANMSHEIRTPMNAIMGFARLGLKLEGDPKARDYFQKVATASQNLLGIINDILDFSKIESGNLALEAVPFRTRDLIQKVEDLLTPRAQEKGLELLLTLDREVPAFLVGDPLRLGQVLTNLVGNAIKFTERGQVWVKVSLVRADGDQAELRFEVKDSGIGISPEDQAKLFQAFSQADTSTTRRFGGTGLGLSISRRLVGLMGGVLAVASEVGVGSVFEFTLTFPVPVDPPSLSPAAGEVGASLRGASVLLVEDNAINQEVAREILQSAGLRVDVAWNGLQAVRMVEHSAYDAILMDIQMPEMDGYEATARIREKARSGLPIIAMTAHALAGYREECLSHGMNDYVAKPIDPQELFTVLGRWVKEVIPEAPPPTTETADRAPDISTATAFDFAKGLRRLGGNRSLYARLLGDLDRDVAGSAQAVREAVEAGAWADAAHQAHTVKGIAGNLSAGPLAEAASALEGVLRTQDRQTLPAALMAFENALVVALEAAKAYSSHPTGPPSGQP